eukprot:gene37213-45169_t
MSIWRRSSGRRVYIDLAKDPAVLMDLTPLCKALKTSGLFIDNKAQLTEVVLANVITSLRNHYETHYGISSPRPRPITLLPSSVFEDLSVGGSVHTVLSTVLQAASLRDLKLDTLFSCAPQDLLPILHEVEKNLLLKGQMQRPAVYMHKVPVGLVKRITKAVAQHGGQLVAHEDQATHVVDWSDDIDNEPNPFDPAAPAGALASSAFRVAALG